jgi:hypothetical protein
LASRQLSSCDGGLATGALGEAEGDFPVGLAILGDTERLVVLLAGDGLGIPLGDAETFAWLLEGDGLGELDAVWLLPEGVALGNGLGDARLVWFVTDGEGLCKIAGGRDGLGLSADGDNGNGAFCLLGLGALGEGDARGAATLGEPGRW